MFRGLIQKSCMRCGWELSVGRIRVVETTPPNRTRFGPLPGTSSSDSPHDSESGCAGTSTHLLFLTRLVSSDKTGCSGSIALGIFNRERNVSRSHLINGFRPLRIRDLKVAKARKPFVFEVLASATFASSEWACKIFIFMR